MKKAYDYITNLFQMEKSNITNFPEMKQVTSEQERNNEEQIQEDIGQTIWTIKYGTKKIVDTILAAVTTNDNNATCFYIDDSGDSRNFYIRLCIIYLKIRTK